MDQDQVNPLLKGKAYAIFVREIKRNLGFFESILKKPALDKHERTEASRVSHTIKGGAGMFGLEQISKSASELERVLRELNLSALAERERIKGLVDNIRSAAKEMPEPAFDLDKNQSLTSAAVERAKNQGE